MIAAAAFYVFAAILIVCAAMVVSARNPVHAVLFLILAFFNAAALFLLAGAEFLAMILVIVYVGAVAVLFLFVVMMLDINFTQLREGFQRYAPVGMAVGVVLLIELAGVMGSWKFAPEALNLRFAPNNAALHNTAQLGHLIYTDYVFLFQTSGLVLLVAMIGAIVLTLRDRDPNSAKASRRQNVAAQVARRKEDTLVLVDVEFGAKTQEFFKPLAPVLEKAGHGDHGHDHGHDDHAHGGH
ncbi:MAG: NADH-quinone oxidoreductase subunit J [Acetobacteraceae bacterium]|nr:NADH-quinone oxidoreductase subunit J [Acetobacteraceae bacterium]